jgi:MFS transporter, putative metabolite:H+ symporter
MPKHLSGSIRPYLSAAIIVSALGYFVDVFDLILFSVVRVVSLKDIGLEGDALTEAGLYLINMQMMGMLLGGIIWGIFGDRKGRIKVLFGSILLYSVANIANAFVHSVDTYAFWRFLAGLGLAGEIGAGITLVSEGLPKEKRGIGTTIVATVGVSGAIAAALVTDFMSWRTAYFVGGMMGLVLLVMRASVYESKMFEKIQTANIARGKFFSLFTNAKRFKNYLCCILMGVPVWFLVGILVTLSPEIAAKMNVVGTIDISYVVVAYSIGITIGDFFSGLLSQIFKSRRKGMFIMLVGNALTTLVFFMYEGMSLNEFYLLYVVMGFFCGIWVLIVTVAAELFGTNLRATATSTIPNFVRGSLVILNLVLAQFRASGTDILMAVQIIGFTVLAIAFLAVFLLPETFHKDLDYNE